MKDEQKQRLDEKCRQIDKCRTPEELAMVIWTEKQVQVTPGVGVMRINLVNWIQAYHDGALPVEWFIFRTPRQLAENIWKPHMDDDEFFPTLRAHVVEWIEKYGEDFTEEDGK